MAAGLDPNGEDLYVDDDGNKWGAIFLFGTGDMEQLCQFWGLPGYNSFFEICPWCLANRSTRPYTNCQEDAEWTETTHLTNDVSVRGQKYCVRRAEQA